ncbi:hypothetical protein DSCO28_13100 [Desulfosarcina ovata subsp. sediminis]|uniref:DUF4197 domain-containing protein n=1 Tax=Desulfosarcina ovata subsp. sediminis TaxID=885957 RepID=A0A5K7ZHC0_9BACT|nr:DUF4197 domain-containing protein [Desulfosarcina ovata]BBO80744.1 hypothetical protein DSCO28_13100 [Desulfosarcina ovata subsp. sediminis]
MAMFTKKDGKRKFLFIFPVIVAAIVGAASTVQSGWLEKGTSFLSTIAGKDGTSALSNEDIAAGLKEALHIGTENVVAQLGKTDGFNADSAIHIPLPETFDTIRSALATVGMSETLDDLELKLNRAAELATPKAKSLFWDTISAMTFQDVKNIYNGADDAATRYFESKMTPALTQEMQPIVSDSLSQVGAIQTYDQIMGKYSSLPFVPDVKADLTTHVIEKGLDGIFYYVAKEEAAIREDPVRQTTDLLKRVFGTK